MYTISELSQMFSLPASTIRYYEKIGLLENVIHTDAYHRSYDDSHIDRLNAIECFKRALLPLQEIKAFFEYEKDISHNADSILSMMKEQEKQTLTAMKDLEIGLAHLRRKIRYYSMVKEAVEKGEAIPQWSQIEEETESKIKKAETA